MSVLHDFSSNVCAVEFLLPGNAEGKGCCSIFKMGERAAKSHI